MYTSAIAEGVGGHGLGRSERFQQLSFIGRDGHADAPASGGLDDDGIADVGGDGFGLPGSGDALVGARHHGDTAFYHLESGSHLVAHEFQHPGGRPYELDSLAFARGGETRVLGQEPIAGMDGVGATFLGGGDDLLDVEIALAKPVPAR